MNQAGRLTAADFDQRLLNLFDDYVHGRMTRERFLDRATPYVRKGQSSEDTLAALQPDYVRSVQVQPDDPAIRTERVSYDSPRGHGQISALMAWPAYGTRPRPGVLVIHENRGLNPYIADVTRRLAKAGFLALAPDGLSPLGGYPGNDARGREMQATLDPDKLRNDFFAAVPFLRAHERCNRRVAALGFCYGGAICNALAVHCPELSAAVAFYGRQPRPDEVPAIRAPLLLHYAELDETVNAGWPAFEAALKKNGKAFAAHLYPGANHGFHNDSTPRYDAAAATMAWGRTLAFLGDQLA